MSGRVRLPWLRFALIAGLAAGIAAAARAAEPPEPLPGDKIDDRSPIPPENPKQTVDAARFRIPKDKGIFTGTLDPKTRVVKGGIEDNRPLASEKQNADEYQALTDVMLHAAQFSAAELAEHGRRDLTPDDLTFDARFQFRLELIRFEGNVTRARRLQPTRSLQEAGFKELFEARLVPEDESPGYPLILLLSAWPEEFPKLPPIAEGKPAGEFISIDKWAAFGGYSFKLMTYPGPGADPKQPTGAGWLKGPLLIGRSLVPTKELPPKIALDKNLRIFKASRDYSRMKDSADFWEDWSAWNRLILHSRRFTEEQLEAAASRKIGFPQLLENYKDYRFDLVYFQGVLIRVVEGKCSKRLVDAGIENWYDGWLIPDGEPSGHPINIAITELPPGVEPKASMNVRVAFAGYSYKLRRYESGEKDSNDPSKYVDKKAPLLIGRSVTVLQETDDATAWWREGFVPAVVGGVAFLAGAALLMGWLFRRGDRNARAEIEANRHRNPFTQD
ncbi:MAG TPA: hypothetical protein VGI99_06960 [Gemmataceae bacterium]|jgi:hypothetical protein